MASKYSGYMGRVLKIDLTTQQISDYPFSDRERELFIGGKSMADKILYDNLTGKEEALSEENLLVITTGPFTGTGAPCSNRFNISSLSPQTGIIASSNCGGTFGYFLKRAGFDALIITGKSKDRVWIEIVNDEVTFHDAGKLWGTNTGPAQAALPKHTGKIVIGPGGENLVRFAGIVSDERIAGRAGMGAVMGFKNLKAITAFGSHMVKVHDPARWHEYNKKWWKSIAEHPLTGEFSPKLGTAGLISGMQAHNMLSTKNYSAGQYEDYEMISGERLAEEYNVVNKGCASCPIRCSRSVMLDGKVVKGPELETLCLLSSNILNNDMEKVFEWNYILDELGLDTISAANTLAYAMEANEKGLWDNGLEFGKTEGISELWDDIAHRRGMGAELAEGSKRLSEKYGGKDFAIHSKGLELAAYEPRGAVGQGLGYAVSNRGGCHLNAGYAVLMEGLGLAADPHTPHGKPDLVMLLQDLTETVSSAGQCLFTVYPVLPAPLIKNPNAFYSKAVNKVLPYCGAVLRAINVKPEIASINVPLVPQTKGFELITGMKMDLGSYAKHGERGYNLERSLDAMFGITAKDDTLPARLTDELQNPADPDSKVPLEQMKKVYYKARGWNAQGLPTVKKLHSLQLLEKDYGDS